MIDLAERLHHPAHRRMLAVLDLDPVPSDLWSSKTLRAL
jgi:hypothetical protein